MDNAHSIKERSNLVRNIRLDSRRNSLSKQKCTSGKDQNLSYWNNDHKNLIFGFEEDI